MKYGVIHETAKENKQYSIKKMCRYLHVSRSGYYEWLGRGESPRKIQEHQLKEKIFAIFEQNHKRYGSPRIRAELRNQGIYCSKKRIERIMRELGLQARKKRKFVVTTDSNHHYPFAENLLDRQFQVKAPNQVWATDFTYIRTMEGWLYLAGVMDLFSRRIVGWAMQDTMETTLTTLALKMAIHRRQPSKGLIHHSDRGIQYACDDYRTILEENQMVSSMSRKGNCWDNAPMESFFSTLKTECIRGKVYLTRSQARREIFEYIEVYYNRKRIHSSIGNCTPENFEIVQKYA